MKTINKNQKIVLVMLSIIAVISIGIYFLFYKENNEYSAIEDSSNILENISQNSNTSLPEIKETILVHITGCVNKQGIVKLKEGARIANAIDAAEGLSEKADMNQINLAYPLEDGQKIYIPSVDDTSINSSDKSSEKEYVTTNPGDNVIMEDISDNNSRKGETNVMININTATQAELESIPGIGPSTALKILEYRQSNGKFSSIEDIKNIKGIGDAKYESMKNSITVK